MHIFWPLLGKHFASSRRTIGARRLLVHPTRNPRFLVYYPPKPCDNIVWPQLRANFDIRGLDTHAHVFSPTSEERRIAICTFEHAKNGKYLTHSAR